MNVGVLLLTHETMGQALLASVQHVMGRVPDHLDAIEIAANANTEQMLHLAARHVRDLDHGDGVLVLTDLYGATPSNIARCLSELGLPIQRVSGLNLPMLLRVLNYSDQSLDELTQIAANGGRGGIFINHA